jgi:hypothetical protein
MVARIESEFIHDALSWDIHRILRMKYPHTNVVECKEYMCTAAWVHLRAILEDSKPITCYMLFDNLKYWSM